MPKQKNFSIEQIQEIIKLYENNKTQNFIANLFNCSRSAIKTVLTKNNVPLRKKTHKYVANYSIFNKIDSEEKAYWLGFIAADGCVYERESNASLIINLSSKDYLNLKKFQDFVKTNQEVKIFIQNDGFSNSSEMCKIVLNSKELVNDLKKVGIVPRKSLILKPPMIKPNFFIPFIRGYFDGDGSIYELKQNQSFGMSIQGTKEMLEWIDEILKFDAASFNKRNNNSVKNNFYIRCGGNLKTYRIMKQIYDNASIYLERKFDKFLQLQTVVLNRNINELLDRELLENPKAE